MLESKIESNVISFLKKNGIIAKSIKPKPGFNGVPDVLCAFKGFLFVIEIKIDDKKYGLSSEQLEFLMEAGKHSFVYYGGIKGGSGVFVGGDGVKYGCEEFIKHVREMV